MNKTSYPAIKADRPILEQLDIPIRYAITKEEFSKIEQYYSDGGEWGDEVAVLAIYE